MAKIGYMKKDKYESEVKKQRAESAESLKAEQKTFMRDPSPTNLRVMNYSLQWYQQAFFFTELSPRPESLSPCESLQSTVNRGKAYKNQCEFERKRLEVVSTKTKYERDCGPLVTIKLKPSETKKRKSGPQKALKKVKRKLEF